MPEGFGAPQKDAETFVKVALKPKKKRTLEEVGLNHPEAEKHRKE